MARRVQGTLVLLVAFAAAAIGEGGSRWADIGVLEQRENATVPLLVSNRAASDVTLAKCGEQYVVPAGGNLTIPLMGLTGFWIVPAGVQWDCQKGPFNLFTVAANLTGPDLVAAVGYGLPSDMENGTSEAASDTDMASGSWTDKVAGMELGAGTDAGQTARCRADECEQGFNVTSVPEQLELTIMGPQVSLLSFWYAGGWRAGGGGWGGGWRAGGWRAGGWGWRAGGWRAGGWRAGGCGYWCR